MNVKTFINCIAFTAYSIAMCAQNDYGVGEANSKFTLQKETLGGNENYDYFSLKDHPDVSGVPLGGIGVGNINLSPSGAFTRIGMNNIHFPIKRSELSFFSLWANNGETSQVVRLVRDGQVKYGIPGVKHTQYKGLFPTAQIEFSDNGLMVLPTIRAYSGLVPHNIKDSSLPVVWFEVDLVSNKDTEASIAFSWEDFIGLFKDPESIDKFDNGQLLSGGRADLVNGENWPMHEKVETNSRLYKLNNIQGILQYATDSITPKKLTFQNYINKVFIGVENEKNVSYLPAFKSSCSGWKNFIKNGVFEDCQEIEPLTAQGDLSSASAIAVKTHLYAGKKKTIRFMLAWFAPELHINAARMPIGSYWPCGADYNKYYHNNFNSIENLIQYADFNRERILRETKEWQTPVLNSSLPEWYKFKLINSAYVIYTNMVLTKGGEVMVNEGAMGGFGGTMDQRLSAHPFYQKFFTQLDRSEMNIFAGSIDPEGYILHFIGHYYVGIGSYDGKVPTEKGWMLDNCSGWIIQLIKDYEQSGDIEYLRKHVTKVKRIIRFLYSRMPEGSSIPVGPTTYDDFVHPPLYSYYAGVWLATLKAYQAMGEAINDQTIVEEAKNQFNVSQKEIIDKLWTGDFFAYGCEPDGSKRLDKILFTGQLAGQFLSRYCGWGDIYPMDIVKSSIRSQFNISLMHSTDYYANKVWDINLKRGIDAKGSQCWPFYLESYTALAGIQAGFYDDGMDIMKHIQLVHLRNGWSWTQNLWNPSDVTYMTAPVTWFSTDVLAGAGINVPKKELRLSPIVSGDEVIKLPVFYPDFWGEIYINPKTHNLSFKVIKTFSHKKIIFNKIISEAIGLSTEKRKEIKIKDFVVREGNVLDLSQYWTLLINPQKEEPILLNSKK